MGGAPILRSLEGLPHAKAVPGGRWRACCPAHEDSSPSLDWRLGDDGRVLLTCRAGCAPEAVVEAIGARMADLFVPSEVAAPLMTVATARTQDHEIRDASGTLVAIHRRRDLSDGSKRFTWHGPDGRPGLGGLASAAITPVGLAPVLPVEDHEAARTVDVAEAVQRASGGGHRVASRSSALRHVVQSSRLGFPLSGVRGPGKPHLRQRLRPARK